MEVAIPFKSLRYRGNGAQTWGINLRRLVKWKNEFSYLSLVPAALGTGGVSRMASAATVVGLETPAESKNLELKPYAVSSATTNRTGARAVRQSARRQRRPRLQVRADAQPDPGRDLPHRLRPGRRRSAAGQPHALQPVLPGEARLLHRRPGHLRFRRRAGRQQPGRRAAAVLQPADRPQLGPGGAGARRRAADRARRAVQHRRCSTSRPTTSPAARAVVHQLHRAAPQAQPAPPQQRRHDCDAARARRCRRRLARAPARAYSLGVDATMLFFKSINLTGYYARTSTPNALGVHRRRASSYRGRFDYTDDRYGAAAEHMLIDGDFRPEVGFVRRTDIRRTLRPCCASARVRGAAAVVRKLTWQASLDYVTDAAATDGAEPRGRRAVPHRLPVERPGGAGVLARVRTAAGPIRRSRPAWWCRPAATPPTPRGSSYTLGQQRRVSGRLSAATGTLYGGTRSEAHLQRPLGRGAALLDRAGPVVQLGAAAVRRLHRAAGELAVHGDAERAHADQQPGSVQRRRQDAHAPACGCAGNTPAAASCSSSTATAGTPATAGFPGW